MSKNDLSVVTVGFVAVGVNSTVVHSQDGDRWTRVNSGDTSDVRASPFRKMRAIVLAVVVVVLAACEMDGVPRVEGTYTGTGTIVYIDFGLTVEASIRMVVEQAGSEVTISGSITIADVTVGLDAVSGTIDKTGFFEVTRTSVVDPAALDTGVCGRGRAVSGSLAFSNGEVRYTSTVQYVHCGTVTLQATLTR